MCARKQVLCEVFRQCDIVLGHVLLHHSGELLELKVLLLEVIAHIKRRHNARYTKCTFDIATAVTMGDHRVSEHEHLVRADAHNSPHRSLVDRLT